MDIPLPDGHRTLVPSSKKADLRWRTIVAASLLIFSFAGDPRANAAETSEPVVSPEYPVEDREVVADRGRRPAVAFSGSESLVVWEAAGAESSDIFGARVYPDYPKEIDDRRMAISISPDEQSNPAVAWGGSSFLVVWESSDGDRIIGARVGSSGEVLDPDGILISSGSSPSVAWGGSSFLVVSQTDDGDVIGARVGSSGEVLDPDGILISSGSSPSVAWGGSSFLVVWETRSGDADVVGARVTEAGRVLDPSGIPISAASGRQSSPSVTLGASGFLVVWEDTRDSTEHDIYAARFTGDGQLLDPAGIAVSTRSGSQRDPSVAWAITWQGPRSLALWWDDDLQALWGARISDAGEVLDPGGFRVIRCCLGFPTAGEHPVVAWDGSGFLVISEYFSTYSGAVIVAAEVGPGGCGDYGCNSGATPIPGIPNQSSPSLAWGRSSYLIVWSDSVHSIYGSSYGRIFAARLSAAGELLDPRPILIATPYSARSVAPAVTWNGSQFLVAWRESSLTGFGSAIRAARVSESGEVLDPDGIEVVRGSKDSLGPPQVVSSGSTFFLVYSSTEVTSVSPNELLELSHRDSTVLGVRITEEGTATEPTAIGTAPAGQTAPAVAWNGTSYLVAWLAGRSVDVSCGLWCEPSTRGVSAARVSDSGVVLDPVPISVAPSLPSLARSFCTNHPLGPKCSTPPSVAGNESGFLVTWGIDPTIFAARVTNDGIVLDPTGIAVGDNLYGGGTVASTGGDFLVAWTSEENYPSAELDVYGARVTWSGSALDPGGLSLAHSPDREWFPAFATGPADTVALAYVRGGNPPPARVFVRFIGDSIPAG